VQSGNFHVNGAAIPHCGWLPLCSYSSDRRFRVVPLLGTSWRFCIFFLGPFAYTCFVTLVAIGVGLFPLLADSSKLHLLWTIPLALVIGRVLIRWPGKKVFFSYLLDDWAAASDRILPS
jgi:hypothetical protein